MLAQLILIIHLLVICFNVVGLVAIPLGKWLGWAFIHAPVWRLLHIASLGVTAAQAMAGQACFLTVWQHAAGGDVPSEEPLIMRWVNSLIFWPLPEWVFTLVYALVFAYVLALLRIVPLKWKPGRIPKA